MLRLIVHPDSCFSGPDEVLLKLNATGLCMSDIHFMANDWAVPPMSQFNIKCAGHEGAGVVVKVGANVTGWKVGDRGGVKPLWDTCGKCELCWTGRENYCQAGVYTGLAATGMFNSSKRGWGLEAKCQKGTYQQYITSPAKYTSPIPDGVSDYVAGPIMCSASTMHRALIDSGLKTGQWVVFPGKFPNKYQQPRNTTPNLFSRWRGRSRYSRCSACESHGHASHRHR